MADTKELNRIRRDVLVGCSVLFSIIMVIAIIPRASTPGGGSAVALAGVWVGVSMLSLVLARSGRWLRASSLLYCISLFAILVLLQLNVGFFPAPAVLGFFLVSTLAGFLLGGAMGLAFGLLACGLAIDGERERCLREGMDDFISKPYRKEELKERLGYWLCEADRHRSRLSA